MQQGLSFTVAEAPHPMDDPDGVSPYDARGQFSAAHRVWLGWAAGTDWLHDAVGAEFGEDTVWYDVQSKRDATHVGASGEVAAVVLILMGAGAADMLRTYYKAFAQRMGEASADALLEWARARARERRTGAPDAASGRGSGSPRATRARSRPHSRRRCARRAR
jgi:hypothetical protein